MNAEDSFEFTKTTLETIVKGIRVYKYKLSDLKNKFYEVIKRLLESLMSSQDKFSEEISKMEEKYKDIETSMDRCLNTDDDNLFFTANEIFLNFSSLNNQYKQLVENPGSKYFSQILEEINFFSQNQMNSLIKLDHSEKWSRNLKIAGFRSRSPSLTSNLQKDTNRVTETSISHKLEKIPQPKFKEEKTNSSSQNQNQIFTAPKYTKKDSNETKATVDLNVNLSNHKNTNKISQSVLESELDSKLSNFVSKKNASFTENELKYNHSINITNENNQPLITPNKEEISMSEKLNEISPTIPTSPTVPYSENLTTAQVPYDQSSINKNLQSSRKLDDGEKFLNKKRRKSKSPALLKEIKKTKETTINIPKSLTEADIIIHLKNQFPDYQIDFTNFLPCLKTKIIQSYEFNLLNVCMVEKKIKEASICSQEDKAYILIKVSTSKQEYCNSSSILYVQLQEFFENRYATFKNSDLLIGGILKENKNFLFVFQYLTEDKFMTEFKINSINLSQYHFLEDIMTDIDEFNSKRVVHNIEKKDFKQRKKLQEMLRNLRGAYDKISE
jgi:hypothetical protein